MSEPRPSPHWLIHRADQAAVASLVVAAMLATIGWWVSHGGWRGRQIEVERAGPLTCRFEVDINTADWPELIQLPGIGPVLAQRIVASRESQGRFADIEDLRRVRGLGPKTLEQIRPYLRCLPVRGSVSGP